jgi:oxygen-independent coproporphyrinogen-3 oxidase
LICVNVRTNDLWHYVDMTQLSDLRRFGLLDAKVPRFTSFPPATWFAEDVTGQTVRGWQHAMPEGADLSLYVHIPFCKRLCWFCACRTQGTKTSKPLEGYVSQVLAEARQHRDNLPRNLKLRRLHFGGGTPTILPPALIERLLGGLESLFGFSEIAELSVEIDPTDVDEERIQMLTKFGMNRASLGIQDFDPKVQEAIGRQQSYQRTREVVAQLRSAGVGDINFDLLYGLPFQTSRSLRKTLAHSLEMQPGRIALFGYAHVPWMSKRQALIPTDALPSASDRFLLFDEAREILSNKGYLQIGIDHFARPSDGLAKAYVDKRLKRSFQGYTDDTAPYLIGLGASAISTYPQGFAQNAAVTSQYTKQIEEGHSPIWRGYALSSEDAEMATLVEELMCYFEIRNCEHSPAIAVKMAHIKEKYAELFESGETRLKLKPWARPLVRIVAAELSLGRVAQNSAPKYSQAI